jgi:hypothetical protein
MRHSFKNKKEFRKTRLLKLEEKKKKAGTLTKIKVPEDIIF